MQGFGKYEINKELLDSLNKMGFLEPTEVQEKAIPIILQGKDIVVRSKTGSGKTGAFLVPIIGKSNRENYVTSLIIAPTRELALQTYDVAQKMGTTSGIRPVVVYGGVSIDNQIKKIRNRSNMVIGTPGRIIDLMKRKVLSLEHVKFLVLDEADTMLDLGFIEDIEYIISQTSLTRQNMLFSATIPDKILALADTFMRSPTYVQIGNDAEVTVSTISNNFTVCENGNKVSTLLAYLSEYNPRKAIIFTEQKRSAATLSDILKQYNHVATVMHGDLTQAQREKALSRFRNGAKLLIATNVAARGLDISDISDIINFDAPSEPNMYVHRVGRSARMGKDGNALTIVEQNELEIIENIENSLDIRMNPIKVDENSFSEAKNIVRPRYNNFRRPSSHRPQNSRYGGRRDYHHYRSFRSRNY
ncbi:MAG: DEAD/DEAH box helicase [Candidatus Thermoplasmatota archaeon]|jgi:ATP-dependent RNA helicase DeaD|nr:DEAD/DEAH box helicase [Candidatus Thermoplasmatota archaeon]